MDPRSRNIIIVALAAVLGALSVALLKPDALKLPEAPPPAPVGKKQP